MKTNKILLCIWNCFFYPLFPRLRTCLLFTLSNFTWIEIHSFSKCSSSRFKTIESAFKYKLWFENMWFWPGTSRRSIIWSQWCAHWICQFEIDDFSFENFLIKCFLGGNTMVSCAWNHVECTRIQSADWSLVSGLYFRGNDRWQTDLSW